MNKKEKKSILGRLFSGGSCNCGTQIIEEKEEVKEKETKKEDK